MILQKNIWVFYQWFTNPNKERIVSKVIYLNYIFLLSAIGFLTFTVINYIIGLPILSVYAFFVFLTILFLWYLNRFLMKTNLALAGGLVLISVLVNLFYIINNNSLGPTSYYVFPATFIILYFGSKKTNYIISVLILINISIITYLESEKIIIANAYDSRFSQFLDITTSLIITVIILVIFISDIIKIHINEKRISEESNKLKTAFLANTSHDIQAPVNSIHGFCTLLDDDEITDEQLKQYIGIIQSNSNQLLSLIDDIFDISIIESGNFNLHPDLFDVNKLIENIQQTFEQIIKNTGKDIQIQAHFGLHKKNSIIFADSVRINQIISNLLQNAINHTSSGAIIFGYEKELSTNHLLFYVKDTGSGIPSDKIDLIFERNITIISEGNKSGTGLGLHIARSLLKLMHGEIWVKSKIGEGSHFFFRIPHKTKKDNP